MVYGRCVPFGYGWYAISNTHIGGVLMDKNTRKYIFYCGTIPMAFAISWMPFGWILFFIFAYAVIGAGWVVFTPDK